MSKPYRPIDEIIEIFWITLPNAKCIIKKHKVDFFQAKGKFQVHVKDFYTAYTKHFNPSLFDVGTSKSIKKEKNISDIFQQLFGSAYSVNQ